jgi:tellurite resistance protein TerC
VTSTVWPWIIFTLFVLGMLTLDLGVFHRQAHVVSKKEAALWSLVWILLALTFNAGIYYFNGPTRALEFLTGYLIEKSLSVDNIFVFIMIFSYFAVPAAYQHKVLFWGILGALLMRGLFIATGAVLLRHFHWVIYIFGAFLIFTGIKMLTRAETSVHPEDNPVIKLLRRLMPITERYEGSSFFVKHQGQRFATPLFVVLLTVESTDLVFAVDSVPAIFAVTDDPFIVYTSNVFAILGLRALYFLLAGIMDLFCYLRHGLGFVLGFVGIKMMLADVYEIPIGVSLGMVAGILGLSIAASLLVPQKSTDISVVSKRGVTTGLLRKWLGKAHWQLSMQPGQVWLWSSIVAAVGLVILAAAVSIRSGPSAQRAALAVRMAQSEVAAVRGDYPGVKLLVLRDAEAELSLAQAALAQGRYSAAITASTRASQLTKKILGQSAP